MTFPSSRLSPCEGYRMTILSTSVFLLLGSTHFRELTYAIIRLLFHLADELTRCLYQPFRNLHRPTTYADIWFLMPLPILRTSRGYVRLRRQTLLSPNLLGCVTQLRVAFHRIFPRYLGTTFGRALLSSGLFNASCGGFDWSLSKFRSPTNRSFRLCFSVSRPFWLAAPTSV